MCDTILFHVATKQQGEVIRGTLHNHGFANIPMTYGTLKDAEKTPVEQWDTLEEVQHQGDGYKYFVVEVDTVRMDDDRTSCLCQGLNDDNMKGLQKALDTYNGIYHIVDRGMDKYIKPLPIHSEVLEARKRLQKEIKALFIKGAERKKQDESIDDIITEATPLMGEYTRLNRTHTTDVEVLR